MSGTHGITVKVQDGEAQVALVCHAVPTAPCRCRPADWEDREEWTRSARAVRRRSPMTARRRIALAALLALTAIALVCCWLTWITKENFDAHL